MQLQDQHHNPIYDLPAVPGGYISAVDAAARFGLTNDHIASLCRKGKIEGALVGRSRYVSLISLEAYLEQADRERAARKTALSKQLKQEYRERAHEPAQEDAAPAPVPEKLARPRSPYTSHEPHVYGLSFALGLLFIGVGYASAALSGGAAEAARQSAAAIESNIISGAFAVADLYPAQEDAQQVEELVPAQDSAQIEALIAARKQEALSKEPKDTFASAGWMTAAVGNTLFYTALQASQTAPEQVTDAAPAAWPAAQPLPAPAASRNTALRMVASSAAAFASLPYEFFADTLGRFAWEVEAVYGGIARATDAAADAQNYAYARFVHQTDAAAAAYAGALQAFSEASFRAADTFATAYEAASVAFVKSADDTAVSQANAYVAIAGGAGDLASAAMAGASAVDLEAAADAYAWAVGGFGKAFVAGAEAVSYRYAALLNAFVGASRSLADAYAAGTDAFVAGTYAASDAYAWAVGNFSSAFVSSASGLADAQARMYVAVANSVVSPAADAMPRLPDSVANTAALSLSGVGDFFIRLFRGNDSVAAESPAAGSDPQDPQPAAPSAPLPALAAPQTFTYPILPRAAAPFVTEDQLNKRLEALAGFLIPQIRAAALSPSLPRSVVTGGSGGIDAIPPLSDISGLLSVGQGGTGLSSAPSYGQLLLGNSSGGYSLVATSSLGIVGAGGSGNSFSYLFPGNATSSLIAFSGGLASYASTTIGGGTQASGLTVFGGATTTGSFLLAGGSSGSGTFSLGGTNGSSIFNQEITHQVNGNNSTLLFKLNHGSLPGSNEANTARFYGPNTSLEAVNENDSLGIKFAESWSTGFLGLVSTGGASGSVPSNGFLLSFALGNGGKVGSIVPATSYNSPSWRNVLDDGSGNLTVSGNLGIGTTSPYAKLSVAGTVVANTINATSTATSTFAGAVRASCFTTDGSTCIAGGGGGSFSYPFPGNATTTGLGIYASSTIGGGAYGLTVNGTATTTGNAYFGGNIYLGGYDPLESIFVQKSVNNSRGVRYTISNTNTSGQSYAGAILYANNQTVASQFYADGLGTGPLGTPGFYIGNFSNHPIGFFTNNTEKMRLTADGNLAIGTTSPYARLTVWGASSASGNAVEIANSASTSLLTLSNAGIFSVGANGSNAFTVDAATGSTTIANLSIGNLTFDTNAGVVALSNIPVDSSAASGVIQSQSINIGDTSVLTAYGESNGGGGVQNLRVGIGTTSPFAALAVVGQAVASFFTATTAATSTFPWLLSTNATTTTQYITGLAAAAGAYLAVDPSGKIVATTTPSGGSSFSYLFPNNATSTALGLYASTTIGAGAQASGLTVFGGATTTGNLLVQGSLSLPLGTSATAGAPALTLGLSTSGLYSDTSSSRTFISANGAAAISVGTNGLAVFRTGSASSPSIHNNNNTGLFFPAAGELAVSANGVEAMRFGSSQNVGIGTTSPYAKLSVVGDVVAARFVATTTATSTFAGAIQASCFSIDGTTCLASGGSTNLYASTTIGAGGQGTGLTISGGATTTGRAYFASALTVGMSNAAAGVFIGQQDQNTSPFSVYSYQPSGSFVTVTLTYTTAATWTKPSGLDHITVEVWGGGGGGGGWNGGPYAGGSGGTSSFTYNSGGNTIQATGGSGGTGGGTGGSGGTASGGDTNTSGTSGGSINGGAAGAGGAGGAGTSNGSPATGGSAPGGGGGSFNYNFSGGAGGGGAYSIKSLTAASLGSTETVRVGGGGGGAGASNGGTGNNYGAGGGGAGGLGAGNAAGSTSTTGGNGGNGFSGGAGTGGTAGNPGGTGGANSSSGSAAGGGGGGAGTQGSLSSDSANYTYNNGGAGGNGGDCTGSCFLTGAGGGGGGNAAGGNSGTGTTNQQVGAGGAGGKVLITEYFPASNVLSATPTLTVSGAGKVGFGTSSPVQYFAIQSAAGVTPFSIASSTGAPLLSIDQTGSTTIANGINITSGCYAVNGTCLTGGGNSYASTTIGNGAQAGGLTVSGGATTTGNSYISGRLGVGSTTPWAKLSVDTSNLAAGMPEFAIGSSTRTDFVITQAGTIGIGTSSPSGALSVYGSSGDASVGPGLMTLTLSNDLNYVWGSTILAPNLTTGHILLTTLTGKAKSLNDSGYMGFRFSSIGSTGNALTWGFYSNDQLLNLTAAGNFGIGTTSPYAKLSVAGEAVAANFTATSTTATSTIAGGLNVGSGNLTYDLSTGVTSINNLAVGAFTFDTDAGIVSWADLPISSSASAGTVESYSANIGGSPVLTIYGTADGAGNAANLGVGIGTQTPAYALDVATTTTGGVVARFTNGTGSCTINPTTTSLSCSSDERLKKNILSVGGERQATSSLAQVLLLDPVMYNWTREASSSPKHAGFIAQEVEKIFPDLVSHDENGFLGVNYGGFAPYFAAALQEVGRISGAFRDNLIAWLGDAANGIHDLYAAVFHAQEVRTDKLCVGDVCVTQSQFLAMVQAAGVASAGGETGGSGADGDTATSTPPALSGDTDAATSTPPVPPDDGDAASSTPPAPLSEPPDPAPPSDAPPADVPQE